MKATNRPLTDLLPYALPRAAGLLALLLALAVNRWWERCDAWVEGQLGMTYKEAVTKLFDAGKKMVQAQEIKV